MSGVQTTAMIAPSPQDIPPSPLQEPQYCIKNLDICHLGFPLLAIVLLR